MAHLGCERRVRAAHIADALKVRTGGRDRTEPTAEIRREDRLAIHREFGDRLARVSLERPDHFVIAAHRQHREHRRLRAGEVHESILSGHDHQRRRALRIQPWRSKQHLRQLKRLGELVNVEELGYPLHVSLEARQALDPDDGGRVRRHAIQRRRQIAQRRHCKHHAGNHHRRHSHGWASFRSSRARVLCQYVVITTEKPPWQRHGSTASFGSSIT